METVKKRDQLYKIIITAVLFCVFLGLFFRGDYGIAGDSMSYMTMGITREPLYPLFVRMFCRLFGDETFYMPLAFVQNMLSFASVICTAGYLGRKVLKKSFGYFISALILTMPYLMTPIFSRTHLVMANKIMAEGITLPGYYFFVLFLVKLIYEEEGFIKNTLAATMISLLLVLARGQLLLTVVILFVVIGIRLIYRKEYKRLFIPVLIVLFLFSANSMCTKVYHYFNSGVFTATASSKPMILANVLYVSLPEDGKDIKDEKLCHLFERTYDALEHEKMLFSYSGGGMIERALHHEECHDSISFYYFEPIKNEIYYENTESSTLMQDGYAAYMLKQDEIASALTGELLKHNWTRYLQNYINVCMLGFIRSIAVEHPFLNIYALAAYVTGFVLLILTWKKKGFTKEVFFFGMTYVMIIGFVMATSLFLQCITRYMIYNLPFFYIAGLAVLSSWLSFEKRK